MKRPYDILCSDKISVVYVKECKLRIKDGAATATDSTGDFRLPIYAINCLIIGHGVSVTSEFAQICALADCFISFSTYKTNIKSVWHSGKYRKTDILFAQITKNTQDAERLSVAKKMIGARERRSGDIIDVSGCRNIQEILGAEAIYVKGLYRQLNPEFRRNHSGADSLNRTLSLLNSLLYNLTSCVCSIIGAAHSVGFIHGKKGGGFVFDIADIYKKELCIVPAMSGLSDKDAVAEFNRLSKTNDVISDMFGTIREVLS